MYTVCIAAAQYVIKLVSSLSWKTGGRIGNMEVTNIQMQLAWGYSDATYMRLQTICFAPPSIFLNICSRADGKHKRRLKTANSLLITQMNRNWQKSIFEHKRPAGEGEIFHEANEGLLQRTCTASNNLLTDSTCYIYGFRFVPRFVSCSVTCAFAVCVCVRMFTPRA
jgi:hypothetical protein